jgi:hypothetical protein
MSSVQSVERENFYDTDSAIVSANPSVLMATINTLRRIIRPKTKRNFLRRLIPCIFNQAFLDEQLEGLEPDPDPDPHHPDVQVHVKGLGSLGGDIVLSRRGSCVFGPQRLPPPLLLPVLAGRENVWFMGSRVPLDHQVLLEELRHMQGQQVQTEAQAHVHFQEKALSQASVRPEIQTETPEVLPTKKPQPQASKIPQKQKEPQPSKIPQKQKVIGSGGKAGQGRKGPKVPENQLVLRHSDIQNMNEH